MKNLEFYRNIIKKHYSNVPYDKIDEYVEYSLNHLKENIVYLHGNDYPTKDVIIQLFKRGMVKKHLEYNPKIIKK